MKAYSFWWYFWRLFKKRVMVHRYEDGRTYTYVEHTNEFLPSNYLAVKFEYLKLAEKNHNIKEEYGVKR